VGVTGGTGDADGTTVERPLPVPNARGTVIHRISVQPEGADAEEGV
jgi:hypothetical protein